MLCAWRRAQLPALVLPPLLPGLAGRDDALGVLLRVLAALAGTLLARLLCKQLARRAVDVVGDLVGWPPSPAHADGTSARERCARPRRGAFVVGLGLRPAWECYWEANPRSLSDRGPACPPAARCRAILRVGDLG